MPDASTLFRWEQTLRSQTLHALDDRVVQLAKQVKVTRGRKLRLDARLACRPRSITRPTVGCSSTACGCSPAVWQGAKGLVKEQVSKVQQLCCSRLSTARQAAQTPHRQLRRQAEDKEAQQKELYQKLIRTSEHLVRQSQQVLAVLRQQIGPQARRKRCRRS